MSQNASNAADEKQFEISQEALGTLGLNQIAFIKPVREENGEHFVVHAADGTAVRLFPSREMAELAIRQNDLQPVSLH